MAHMAAYIQGRNHWGVGGVLTPPTLGATPPTFETGFFLGGSVLGGSVTRGVWTIIYESLQCTNYHVEPAFRCKIVVDFQYVPRILPRRFVSLLKSVHFFVGYDNENKYRIRRKKNFAYHF